MTEKKETVTIELVYNEDGSLDELSAITAFENAIGGRMKITDWYGMTSAKEDYPHLQQDQLMAVISELDTGEYDFAINRDIRRAVLDGTVEKAGFYTVTYDSDFDEDDVSERDESDEDFKL